MWSLRAGCREGRHCPGRTLGQARPDRGVNMTCYSLAECESLWSRWLFRNPEHLLSESENRLFQFLPPLSSALGSTCSQPGPPDSVSLSILCFWFKKTLFRTGCFGLNHQIHELPLFRDLQKPPRGPFIHFSAQKSHIAVLVV